VTGALLGLVRPKLCVLAAVATLAGYVSWRPTLDADLWLALAGALLLAAGSGALNQYQERETDRLMARTAARPLTTGRLSRGQALWFVALSLGLSLVLLSQTSSSAVVVGAVVLAVYNGVYTPLKRLTPFAILAGGVAGALPPLLGWCAAGGSPADFRVLAVAGVLYLWQVPHFWMLAQRHESDYRAAKLPVFTGRLACGGGAITLWLSCFGLGVLLIPALGLVSSRALALVLVAAGLAVILGSPFRAGRGRHAFHALNASLLLFLAVLIADAIIEHV